jgi:hypothetical protein
VLNQDSTRGIRALAEGVITEFVSVLKSYHCHRVIGDHYGGEFPREQFRNRSTTDQTIRS